MKYFKYLKKSMERGITTKYWNLLQGYNNGKGDDFHRGLDILLVAFLASDSSLSFTSLFLSLVSFCFLFISTSFTTIFPPAITIIIMYFSSYFIVIAFIFWRGYIKHGLFPFSIINILNIFFLSISVQCSHFWVVCRLFHRFHCLSIFSIAMEECKQNSTSAHRFFSIVKIFI